MGPSDQGNEEAKRLQSKFIGPPSSTEAIRKALEKKQEDTRKIDELSMKLGKEIYSRPTKNCLLKHK